MSHVFFKPSDIRTIVCSVINITRGGSAFAVTEDNEYVFINPKIVDQTKIDVGDYLTAYCIDNHRPEVDGEHQSRWRAIRIVVTERFVTDVPEVKAKSITDQITPLFRSNRAWTSAQIAKQIGEDHMRVTNALNGLHDSGQIAVVKVYAKGGQDRCSAMFFARDVALIHDLIDEVELDD